MMRKLLLFFAMLSVSIGAWAGPHDITQQDGKYYIGDVAENNYYTVENGVLTFHVAKLKPTPPDNPDAPREAEDLINKAWNNISNNLGGATRIAFANDCFITQADIETLFTNGSNFYFDFYEITNGTNTPMKIDDYTTDADDGDANNIDQLIAAAVNTMASQGKQAKGIILPLNTGIGTTAVEKANSGGGETFTEYAVYYRDTQKTAAIYAHDSNMRYNWEWATSNTDAQNHYNTAYTHLSSHREVADAETYIVSTNNKKRGSDDTLDLSSTITGSNVTKISIINDELVYTGQSGRSNLAGITVEGAEAGKFAEAVANTGIKDTPCEKLIVQGPVNGDDVAAVNEFTSADGPLVYSLAAATGVTKEMLLTITNSKLEYLVLPNAMATEQIVASEFSSSLTNLKAAIAPSADKTKLSAYVKVAGSLSMARYYATGGTVENNNYNPNATNLTDVILSGSLSASDINVKGDVSSTGHWGAQGSNAVVRGLNGENSIVSIDLENAVFETQSDMNFSYAGYEKLTSIKLPTSSAMNTIPANCMENISTLTYLCVPYNYEYIEDGAFWLTGINHMTTTDASGAEVDNGPKTWTISANVKQLGLTPATQGAMVKTIYPQNVGVEEIYCLAVKVPKCYGNVFPANACYGWGGDDSTMPYSRDKYYNGGNKNEAWAVLRFPSKESWEASAGTKEADYETLKKLYTDVNKVFTKKEQTGAVDANGDAITWPTHWEGYRSYNQASFGYTWNDWAETHNSTIDGHVNGGSEVNQGVTAGQVYSCPAMEADGGTGTGEGDYDFWDYIGWHQIVLAQATYVKPDEEIVNEEIVRNYEVAGLYTFCIPYDLTIDEVCELMGVPASDDSKKIVNMFDRQKVTEPIMPEIYQLASVTRYKGSSASDNNIVNFILSENLYSNGATKYLEIDHDTEVISTPSAADTQHPNRCLVGGRPYIIKAYKRLGEKISGQNLGKLVMTRYADKFDESASCINSGLYEQLGSGNVKTLQFAIPYEQHKVQAIRRGGDAQPLTYDDGDGDKKYYYTMVGQYWEQDLPLYCIYMSNHAWYRYTGKNGTYKWAPYKCIIMPTQEISDKGGGYRSDDRSNYPNITGTDLLDGEFKLGFLDGRDDDDFNSGNGAKYMFTFDDGFEEYDAEGNLVTAIKKLDGEDLTIGTGNGKVYNMSGQYVGKSVNGLPKGMYIVNGKKYVIK